MKYILKKEYPGSPKLGNIIDNLENDWIENYPEFWEEVDVEKDYEILSLARFCSIKPTITDVSDYDDEFIEAMLKCDNARIHSVKRNDGEIFTIGDKTNFGLISKIVINNNSLSFYFEQKSCGYNLQTLIKWKPLFTTEDGVDIFEGDSYYAVNTTFFNNYGSQKAFNKKSPDLTPFWQSNRSVCKYFSTKEKAEEYILLNKPCLSVNDIKNTFPRIFDKEKELIKLVKLKIQQSV